MARTNVDIDDRACAEVMRRYQLPTKREAINFALRTLAAEPASVDEARSLRGIGWEGDLDSMRSNSLTVILVDTSAWVEFLRDTGSAACFLVEELLAADIAVCEPVRMEVLAGARDESHLLDLRRLLARAVVIPTQTTDYEDAAALYRPLPPGRGDRA